MSRFVVASSAFSKLAGLFAFGRDEGAVLMLAGCSDIHTVGMPCAIDIAFLDARGVVLESLRDAGPWRRFRCPGAVAVLERYAEPAAPWPAAGWEAGAVFPEVAEALGVFAQENSRKGKPCRKMP